MEAHEHRQQKKPHWPGLLEKGSASLELEAVYHLLQDLLG
jgi:hypothetical protein